LKEAGTTQQRDDASALDSQGCEDFVRRRPAAWPGPAPKGLGAPCRVGAWCLVDVPGLAAAVREFFTAARGLGRGGRGRKTSGTKKSPDWRGFVSRPAAAWLRQVLLKPLSSDAA
jgi:hypothetical protein